MRRIVIAVSAFVIFLSCKSDFEKGNSAFQERQFETAITHLEKVEHSEDGYVKAREFLNTSYYEVGVALYEKKAWKRSIDFFMKVGDSEYTDQAERYISDAKDALINEELDRCISEQSISGLDQFIQQYSGTPYANNARDAKEGVLKYFLEKQRLFEQKQVEFDERYDATNNDVRKSLIFNEANRWSTDYMSKDDFRFKYWEGKLVYVTTGKGGDQASIQIDSRTTSYKADVPSSSPIYRKFLEVEEGNIVLFSGGFAVKEGILSEYSMTEFGRMVNPGFDIFLTDISIKNR